MVALVLGFILIAGVLNIFNSNRENFRVTENLARIQENSRVAFDFMARNVREAGQTPCGAKLMANVLRSGGTIPWWADWNSGTIVGYDGSQDTTGIVGFGTSSGSRVAGTDAILIIKAAGNETNITLHNTATNELTLASTSGLQADDVVVACDLQTAALFQIGTLSASTKILNYDSSFTTLNCANGLGYPTPLNCAATTLKLFSTNGGQLTKLDTTFWYIGYNSTGGKSLYKTRISRKTVAGVVQIFADKDEVAPNVKDMQITYLTKDLAADTLATTWSDASDTKFSSANGAWTCLLYTSPSPRD